MINRLLYTILSHFRYLKRLVMSLFVCIVFLPYINSQQISTNNDAAFFNEAMTSYLQHRKNEAGLYQTYGNNACELNKIDTYIKLYKKEINANKSHLYIVSYVNPREIHNPEIINRSSVRASILRAYIKVKHEIGHEHVAFAIDTIDQRPNVTSITYMPQPIDPEYNSIFYTVKEDRNAIAFAVKKYESIPIKELPKNSFLIDFEGIDSLALYRLLYKGEYSRILPRVYKSNAIELDRLDEFVDQYKHNVFSEKNHFSATACIHPSEFNNPKVINAAAIQGSVVCSYLKVKHGIDYSHFSFSFDTAHHARGLVFVRYETQPVFEDFNKIYYTSRTDNYSIVQSVRRYKPMPLAENMDKLRFKFNKNINPLEDSIVPFFRNKDSLLLSYTLSRKNLPYVTVKASKKEASILGPRYKPFIGVKINLLYLSGVTPELEYRDGTPSLEMEWYMRKHFSLNMDLTYTYLERNNTDREMWGLSSIALEPRYWLRGNSRFNGVYVGCYGLTGDFDVKLSKLNADGYTGDFYEAGISVGCHIPFSAHWGMELGGRFGYRTVSGDTYYFNDPYYYRRSTFSENKMKLTGLRLLIVYRFNKNMKKGGRK